MKNLFVATSMLILAGALLAPSCGTGDQGTGTGVGGSGDKGVGGTTGEGTGGATTGFGGTNVGTGGSTTGVDAGPGTGGAGVGGSPGGTGGASLVSVVAGMLDGKMLTGPCVRDTAQSVCATVTGACPGANTAGSGLAGVLTTDRTITLGGTPGTMYSLNLHVQGEVESKQYGGMDQNNQALSPRADGFCVGGTPTNADAYNVYLLRVTNPGSTTPTNYFLNSLQAPGVSNHTTYGIDYMAQIKAMGGATIRMLAADSNCSMIKNCGPIENSGNVCSGPITLANVEPTAITANPTFSFTTAYNGQWIVITVKSVTSP